MAATVRSRVELEALAARRQPHGEEARQKPRHKAGKRRDEQHARVWRDVERGLQSAEGERRRDRLHRDPRHADPKNRPGAGDGENLEHELTRQAQTARAERCSHRELAAARGHAGERQASDIDAREQQQAERQRVANPQRLFIANSQERETRAYRVHANRDVAEVPLLGR